MLQSQVYIKQALGQPGHIARLNPIEKIPVIAEGDDVVAGGFVLQGTDSETQVIGLGKTTSEATTDDLAGVFVFEKFQIQLGGIKGLNSLKVNEGQEGALLRKGYVYVISSTASVKGQAVFVNPTTGEIQTADTPTTEVEDCIYTGWTVETGNAAGETCEIYK